MTERLALLRRRVVMGDPLLEVHPGSSIFAQIEKKIAPSTPWASKGAWAWPRTAPATRAARQTPWPSATPLVPDTVGINPAALEKAEVCLADLLAQGTCSSIGLLHLYSRIAPWWPSTPAPGSSGCRAPAGRAPGCLAVWSAASDQSSDGQWPPDGRSVAGHSPPRPGDRVPPARRPAHGQNVPLIPLPVRVPVGVARFSRIPISRCQCIRRPSRLRS